MLQVQSLKSTHLLTPYPPLSQTHDHLLKQEPYALVLRLR